MIVFDNMPISETNADIYFIIFLALFIVGVGATSRIKYLLKKSYPEQHNKVFGKSLREHSISKSIRGACLLFSKTEWEFVQDNEIKAWLRFYRFISLTYILYVFIALISLIVIAW